METLASIEIGTNSIRMLIAEKSKTGSMLTPVLRKRAITRLGKDFNREKIGTIKPESISRSISVLEDFFYCARQHGVSSPIAVATGVVRSAVNRNNFTSLVAKKLGHAIQIISGHEEAYLTCKGVLSSLKPAGEPFIIFDLGGGSTEFIRTNTKGEKSTSIELGVVILTEDYVTSDPPNDDELYQLINHIEHMFNATLFSFKDPGQTIVSIIGTGGTAVNLAAIIHGIGERDFDKKLHGLVIGKHDISLFFERMKGMTRAERLNIKGLEPGREDTILAGALVIMKIMDYFGKNEIIVSYSDILEGILIHYLEGEKNE